ncbi:putative aldouronate transport system substrate-binding protein [Paenibacillus sp. 1_12]|uniref:extracellular solute-binding protein n=1 Tax=Paenibacillus sp. 1_12 TaxID=1566278 RepID=UPI0008E1FA45|nr:extracellular solute-binding protein [Paenibacillus sp. 1_12]SFM08779.1 putative aldouronate transport system substrate-binding protein [Paenibacillus sp. 1_12]
MKQQQHVIVKGSTLLLAASIALTGCGVEGGKTESQGAATPSKPTDVSIMTNFSTPEPPGADNVIVQEIGKRTNTKLNIQWVSPNNYTEKTKVTLASGDIPDLMFVDPFDPLVLQMARDGAFWEITPDMIKSYPNLAAYPKEVWTNSKLQDGKNYGIPAVRPLGGWSYPNIRKDWLDKLGLKVPETIDELFQTMKAFTFNDPDGNGKQDTYGLAGNVGTFLFEPLFNSTQGKWKMKDGKLTHIYLETETRDAIAFQKKLYDEKVIPEDFAVLKTSQFEDMAKANKAGIWTDTVEASWRPTEELRKTIPNADMMPITYLISPSGKKMVYQFRGLNGIYVIPKKVSDAKLKTILQLMDYGSSEEGANLAWYGLKDVHYIEKDGIKTATDQAKKDIVSQSALGKIFSRDEKYLWAYRTGMPNDIFERNKKIIDERAKYAIPDIGYGLYSETAIKLGAEFDKKTEDLKVKIIMGKEPLTAWDDWAQKLSKDADFLKIIKETNDSYQSRMANK